DIVALALLAEFTEVGKITPDLGGRHANETGQLLGGNGSASALDEALQRADIDGETPDDDIWNIVRINVIRRLSQSGVAGTACAGYVVRHLPSGPRAESRPVAGTFPSCQAGLAPPACCRQRWAARVPVHKCNRSRAGDAGALLVFPEDALELAAVVIADNADDLAAGDANDGQLLRDTLAA